MYRVVVYGNSFLDEIRKDLKAFGDIRVCMPAEAGPGCDIGVYCSKMGLTAPPGRCRVGVAVSHTPAALQFFKEKGIPVVTVGRAARDTVTLSSRKAHSAVICLQREICTLAGQRLLPAEYPVCLEGERSDSALLCTAAILLLCGKERELLKNGAVGAKNS